MSQHIITESTNTDPQIEPIEEPTGNVGPQINISDLESSDSIVTGVSGDSDSGLSLADGFVAAGSAGLELDLGESSTPASAGLLPTLWDKSFALRRFGLNLVPKTLKKPALVLEKSVDTFMNAEEGEGLSDVKEYLKEEAQNLKEGLDQAIGGWDGSYSLSDFYSGARYLYDYSTNDQSSLDLFSSDENPFQFSNAYEPQNNLYFKDLSFDIEDPFDLHGEDSENILTKKLFEEPVEPVIIAEEVLADVGPPKPYYDYSKYGSPKSSPAPVAKKVEDKPAVVKVDEMPKDALEPIVEKQDVKELPLEEPLPQVLVAKIEDEEKIEIFKTEIVPEAKETFVDRSQQLKVLTVANEENEKSANILRQEGLEAKASQLVFYNGSYLFSGQVFVGETLSLGKSPGLHLGGPKPTQAHTEDQNINLSDAVVSSTKKPESNIWITSLLQTAEYSPTESLQFGGKSFKRTTQEDLSMLSQMPSYPRILIDRQKIGSIKPGELPQYGFVMIHSGMLAHMPYRQAGSVEDNVSTQLNQEVYHNRLYTVSDTGSTPGGGGGGHNQDQEMIRYAIDQDEQIELADLNNPDVEIDQTQEKIAGQSPDIFAFDPSLLA